MADRGALQRGALAKMRRHEFSDFIRNRLVTSRDYLLLFEMVNLMGYEFQEAYILESSHHLFSSGLIIVHNDEVRKKFSPGPDGFFDKFHSTALDLKPVPVSHGAKAGQGAGRRRVGAGNRAGRVSRQARRSHL